MRIGARIFGVLAGALILYLGIGFFLPGRWEAEVGRSLLVSPETVYPFLSRPAQWAQWNAMPESGYTLVGPEEGTGAGLDWDDPRYGQGAFRITACEPNHRAEYEVRIEGGALLIRGVVTLEADGQGARIGWKEYGDFGRNPLMGYAARGMGRSQREAMEASLDSLEALLESGFRLPTPP